MRQRRRRGLPQVSVFRPFAPSSTCRLTQRRGQGGSGSHEFIRRFLMHVLPTGFHRVRHYGLFRIRLRAELAADTTHNRHVMSQTSSERRRFPVPLRWLHAGGDLSRLHSRRSMHPAPCAVRIRPRCRRWNSGTPSAFSRCFTCWLTAPGVTESFVAAALKLRWRPAASKARKSVQGRQAIAHGCGSGHEGDGFRIEKLSQAVRNNRLSGAWACGRKRAPITPSGRSSCSSATSMPKPPSANCAREVSNG